MQPIASAFIGKVGQHRIVKPGGLVASGRGAISLDGLRAAYDGGIAVGRARLAADETAYGEDLSARVVLSDRPITFN